MKQWFHFNEQDFLESFLPRINAFVVSTVSNNAFVLADQSTTLWVINKAGGQFQCPPGSPSYTFFEVKPMRDKGVVGLATGCSNFVAWTKDGQVYDWLLFAETRQMFYVRDYYETREMVDPDLVFESQLEGDFVDFVRCEDSFKVSFVFCKDPIKVCFFCLDYALHKWACVRLGF